MHRYASTMFDMKESGNYAQNKMRDKIKLYDANFDAFFEYIKQIAECKLKDAYKSDCYAKHYYEGEFSMPILPTNFYARAHMLKNLLASTLHIAIAFNPNIGISRFYARKIPLDRYKGDSVLMCLASLNTMEHVKLLVEEYKFPLKYVIYNNIDILPPIYIPMFQCYVNKQNAQEIIKYMIGRGSNHGELMITYSKKDKEFHYANWIVYAIQNRINLTKIRQMIISLNILPDQPCRVISKTELVFYRKFPDNAKIISNREFLKLYKIRFPIPTQATSPTREYSKKLTDYDRFIDSVD